MELIRTVAELRARTAAARGRGLSIGLVPTMGAFHEGHLSLMRRARNDDGLVVVSLFVNPAQFGREEDLERYPRDLERDAALAAEVGVDVLFTPEAHEVYPSGFATYIHVEGLGEILEGASRPGHFRGVATVVAKLFQMAGPDRAYFGQKDYQQLRVIQRMAIDLDFSVKVVPLPIVREPDGLAMSSRNVYLSPEARAQATVLSRALREVAAAAAAGERDVGVLEAQALATIANAPLARTDYATIVDAKTLAPLTLLDREAVLLLAVRFGSTRLIDNTVLTPHSSIR
jgi:pantoate--beta-alanine ligase